MKTNLKGLLAVAKTIFSSSCTRFCVVLLSCLLWTSVGWGQITLISPTGDGGFETGSTFSANGWTAVNAANNLWEIGSVATTYAGSRGIYVANPSGTYSYKNNTALTSHFYRDVVIPSGATSIILSFYWKGSGESGWDRALIYTAPNSITPVANIPVSNSTSLTGATLVWTQPSVQTTLAYTLATITLPNTLAGTTVRLIFTWQNDASGGTTPGAAIDNISLVYNPPCTTPTAQATSLALSSITATTLSGSFTAASPAPSGYLVVRSTSSTLSSNPVDGTSYTAGASLGGGTVVQSAAGTTFTESTLSANTTYYYFVFAYNNTSCSGGPKYLTASPLTANVTTCLATPTTLTASALSTSGFTANWATVTGASGYSLEVSTNSGFTAPITGSPFSSATNSYVLSGLVSGITYYYRVTASGGSCNSSVSSSANTTITCAAPTSLAASVTSSAQTITTISGSFTAAATPPTGYIVVRSLSATAPTSLSLGTALPAVGNTTAFGSGTYVEYVGTSAGSWTSTGLIGSTTYYYYVFSYNNTSCSGGPAYSASATSFSQSTVICPGTSLAGLTYSSNPANYCLSSAITTNAATLSSSAGTITYSVSPSLPTGLSINSTTGAITGTPTAAVAAANYTVTANNGCTNTSATLSISTLALPGTPTASAATSILPLSFTANWATVTGVSSYILDVATDNTFTNLVTGYNALNVGNVISYSVTGLNAGTTYYYRVRSTNGTCNSLNSSTITVSTTAITSVATGNWNATTTWNSGTVPSCGDIVTILSGHTVSVNSSSNVSKNLTINSGGTLVIASGDLTVGCTLNNTPLNNNGTLTVSGGTLNVNGNLSINSGSSFNQSDGDINIDGNNGGSTIGSVASGTYIVNFSPATNSAIILTGGNFTIIDPHTSTTETFYCNIPSVGHTEATSNHNFKFGNGISSDAGGASGFRYYSWAGTGVFRFRNVIINVGSCVNRFVHNVTSS
ncbi:MAG: hypothetical protein ORN55_08140 [Chitinophagaceae bacterium]|nr:hypothetical protein [Chitinophagaceae bacterium]